MRIRSIKPEFFTHEGVFELERETGLPIRISFAGIWCAADREGRFKWEPRRLGIQILPYDGIDFTRVLDALMTRGFIRRYHVDGEWFGFIPSFLKHQVINNRERPSELPDPLSHIDPDACVTRDPREADADSVEGKGREQGKEGSGRGKAEPAHVGELPMEPGKRMQILKTRINELDPSWKSRPHFTAKDDRNLFDNLSYISALEPESWQLMAEYLSLNLPAPPEGEPKYWQTRNRSQFLENIGDFFNHADRWKTNTQC